MTSSCKARLLNGQRPIEAIVDVIPCNTVTSLCELLQGSSDLRIGLKKLTSRTSQIAVYFKLEYPTRDILWLLQSPSFIQWPKCFA